MVIIVLLPTAKVRQLQRGTGWPFWVVVWPSAILFGYGHVEQAQSALEMAGLFFLTGAGGVAFAWLVYRWQTLWVAAVLHICMNLWWELFSVSKNAPRWLAAVSNTDPHNLLGDFGYALLYTLRFGTHRR